MARRIKAEVFGIKAGVLKIKAEVLSNMRRLSLAPHALIARAL